MPSPVTHENLRGPDYYAAEEPRREAGLMLNQATMDKLYALRLTGMAAAYQKQLEEPEARGLSFEERFGMLVDFHWTWRENLALTRRLEEVEALCRALCRRHQLPLSAADGPGHDARPDQLAMGRATSQCAVYRANRNRQDVAGASSWHRRLAAMDTACLYRSAAKLFRDLGRGAGRRQSGPVAGEHRAHRCACWWTTSPWRR
jgi:hypothetical protein